MVAAFLRAEISSARFSADVKVAMQSFGVEESVISRPDITDARENARRAKVLGAYRGYRQNREMFEGVPDDLTWYDAEITRSEIGDLRYVDYSYWNELTNDTHKVMEGVRNIQKGVVVFGVSNDRFLAFAEEIRNGEHGFEPMILWGHDVAAPLEILEGHLRATALGLAGEKAPAAIHVLVGLVNAPELP